jgi:hypothetical protein
MLLKGDRVTFPKEAVSASIIPLIAIDFWFERPPGAITLAISFRGAIANDSNLGNLRRRARYVEA